MPNAAPKVPIALLAAGTLLVGGVLFGAGYFAGRSGSANPGGFFAGPGKKAGAASSGNSQYTSGGVLVSDTVGPNELGKAHVVLSGSGGWQNGFGATDAGRRFLQGAAARMDTGLLEEELKRFATGQDIPGLLSLVEGKDRGEPGVNGLYDVIFTIWAREDPEAALNWMHQQQDRGLIERAANSIARTYAARDFAGALDWMRRLPENMGRGDRERVIGSIFSEGAKTQPLIALREAQRLDVIGQRRAALGSLMGEWAQLDFRAAWNHTNDIAELGIRGDIQEEMLGRAARSGEEGRKAILAMLDRFPSDKLYDRALEEVGGAMARDNFDDAMRWAKSLPPEAGGNRMVQRMEERWARHNPEDALKEVASMSPGPLRNRYLDQAFNSLSWRDPAEALDRAGELGSEDDQRRVIPRIINNLANMDPTGAADYVSKLPESKLREDAAATLIERWTEDDPASASEWLVKQPDGPSRDRAVEKLIDRIRGNDGESAVAWAVTIADDKKRMRLLEQSLRDWKRHNPNAAKSWVQASQFPDDFKQKFMN
jgi:hypothetical protein